MWQLIQPPFPKHPILPISQDFDLNTSLYIDQNKVIERKEKVIQYIISPELSKQSFAKIKSQTDIYNIIQSGYLFGQFINILYDKHNTYEPRPSKIQRQQNWKKILGVLRQDPALRYEHLFPNEEVFESKSQLNSLFFKILEDLINLFLDKKEITRLKEFTQQLFLQSANKRNLTEDQTKQLLTDEDFPVYLSEQLQQVEYPVNKPVELQSSMENYLSHYGVPNTLFNNDENWRNGYYFYILIKEIIFQKFKVQFPYKSQNIQYKNLSLTQSISQTKQQLSIHQIAANMSNICDFFNQNQITQNMSVYDLQNGNYSIYQEIILNIMKQYPYLKPINSQYNQAEIKIVKQKIINELLWSDVINQQNMQVYSNQFLYIAECVRSGVLTYDYLEHLFNVGVIKNESISSYYQNSPYVNKSDAFQMNKQLLKYLQDIMKLTSKYTPYHLASGSEELVVDFLEQLITYKYFKLSEIPKITQNLNKFMLQYFDQFNLFIDQPIEKNKRKYEALIEEQNACIIKNNEMYIGGVSIEGLTMIYLQPLDFEFLL